MMPTAYDLAEYLAGRDPDGRLRAAMADEQSELRRMVGSFVGREPVSLSTPTALLGFLECSSAPPHELAESASESADRPAPGSATVAFWLDRLQSVDPSVRGQALQHLMNQQLEMLSLITHARGAGPLSGDPVVSAARSALFSMYEGVREGRYPRLGDPGDLWALLLEIAHRKLQRRARELGRELDFDPSLLAGALDGLLRQLFGGLGPELTEIAQRRLAHQPTQQIAAELRLMPESVDEDIRLIALRIQLLSDAA
jgi:hypothetical protein